jgi:hypothetical protein
LKICAVIFFLAVNILMTGINCYSQRKESYVGFYDANKKFSFQVYATYISSSELQNDPNSTDPFERNGMVTLNGGYGYGAELNYKPNLGNLNLTFFLSTEYFKLSENDLYLQFQQDSSSAKVAMTEAFHMIPIEFGVKWDLPVSTNSFKVYIGGGGGMYFGDRTRTIGSSLVSTTTYTKPGFSLNILSGLEYYLERNLSANLELKFREGSFDVESKFAQNSININGVDYFLSNPVYSRIIVDGVRISFGLKYNF